MNYSLNSYLISLDKNKENLFTRNKNGDHLNRH